MTIWSLLNNPATTLVFMAAIGIAALLIGIGSLFNSCDITSHEPNVGDEQ